MGYRVLEKRIAQAHGESSSPSALQHKPVVLPQHTVGPTRANSLFHSVHHGCKAMFYSGTHPGHLKLSMLFFPYSKLVYIGQSRLEESFLCSPVFCTS